MAKKSSHAPASPPKNVLIVDDHPVFRDGLATALSRKPAIVVCGEADNAEKASEAIFKLKPDLVLMDLALPGKSGLELLQDIHAANPALPVIIISMHDESLYAERVLRAGGRGYIMKHEVGPKIVEAVRKVLAGGIYVSEHIAAEILDALSRPRSTGPSVLGKLTGRELEVFRLTGQGQDNHGVAKALKISLKTVDTHRAHIKSKLGLKNATELIHFAVRWVAEQM